MLYNKSCLLNLGQCLEIAVDKQKLVVADYFNKQHLCCTLYIIMLNSLEIHS